MPPHLRGVRVIRDGRVIQSGGTKAANDQKAPEDFHKATSEIPGARLPSESHPLNVGDRVRLLTFGSIGIVDRIKGDEAEVRVGSLHLREKLANLELVSDERSSSPTVREGSESHKTRASLRRQAQTTEVHLRSDENSTARTELNLIGKTTDEAVDLTDKFLDQAFLNGLNEVRIIHGHGTGALRRVISEMLADHPHVAHFAPALQDHGGSGATIVELKQ